MNFHIRENDESIDIVLNDGNSYIEDGSALESEEEEDEEGEPAQQSIESVMEMTVVASIVSPSRKQKMLKTVVWRTIISEIISSIVYLS